MSFISVIIPSYNQPATIERCLNSVLQQEYGGTFEVLVVDSSGAEAYAEIKKICSGDARVRLIHKDEQTYPGVARNIGIAQAKGAIIALIDADCVALPGWLQAIETHTRPNQISTGVIENGTPESSSGTASYLVEFSNFLEPGKAWREMGAAATCNFACYKEVFGRNGQFSSERAFEDFSFCKNFAENGGKIVQYKAIRIAHLNKTEYAPVAANQEMLGYYSAKVRKQQNLGPKVLFRFPVLSVGLVPFRYVAILIRCLKGGQIGAFFINTPKILRLLQRWTKGFKSGINAS